MTLQSRDEFLLVDVVVDGCRYLFKKFGQAFGGWRSSSWPTQSAQVLARRLDGQRSFGCSTVEIVYTYRIGESSYEGISERSYFVWDSAADLLHLVEVGGEITVRVNPRNPSKSSLQLDDVEADRVR